MRGLLAGVFATMIVSAATYAADTGVPLRGASTDYPVHERADAATIAADIVPTSQVAKMFSPEISKQYIVVELAIYPESGGPFDVRATDFALRVGQRVVHADRPIDVAPWRERRDPATRLPVDVTAEAGVIYEHGEDPLYGRRQGVGTYTGVGVSAPGQNLPNPPPAPKVDPRVVFERVRRSSLAEGETKIAIAGYLYFPQFAKRHKSDAIELKFAKDDVTANLTLGKP